MAKLAKKSVKFPTASVIVVAVLWVVCNVVWSNIGWQLRSVVEAQQLSSSSLTVLASVWFVNSGPSFINGIFFLILLAILAVWTVRLYRNSKRGGMKQ